MKNWFAALKARFEGEAWETFVKIVVASVLLLVAIVLEHTLSLPLWALLLIYLVPYFVVGAETLHEAVEAIVEGHAFNEDFLMAVATIGALAKGSCCKRWYSNSCNHSLIFRKLPSSKPYEHLTSLFQSDTTKPPA